MAVSTDKQGEEYAGLLAAPREGLVPFGGKAKSLEIGKDVNEHQLVEEVYDRLGDRDAFEVVVAGEPGQQSLYVLGDADMGAVRQVVDAHTPDPDHGLDEGQREIRQLRDRLVGGEDLPASDLNKLLRAML